MVELELVCVSDVGAQHAWCMTGTSLYFFGDVLQSRCLACRLAVEVCTPKEVVQCLYAGVHHVSI